MATALEDAADRLRREGNREGRPPGVPNHLPDLRTEREWLRKLRTSAELGDTSAMGMLIMLARLHRAERGKKATVEKLLEAIA